ncbi:MULTISPECIES: AI-2E family transporter [Roseovarius]|uniref:AI-2 transport protein TqsA n=1 Tax=Roseovarius mucosus TaxID=215743 RepID=A0A1V0RSE5_9RHOB|nr:MULTISPECIES: AI-2E family transporter [Roseovarius]ARE84532.1 AI-2 transport protein TqsA [Roseovarius mucosus]VVT19345.1 AI-2 transport protein TqsA [Roseovarius sp. EC-SD190]
MHRLFVNDDPTLRMAVIVIALILSFAALKIGGDIFAPMTLAIVTGVMLAPVTDVFERIGFSTGLAASTVLILGVSAIGILAILAEPVIWQIAEELPRIQYELRSIIAEFSNLIRGLQEINREVEAALGAAPTPAKDAGEGGSLPSITSALFMAPLVLAQALVFCGTLFFFLLTRKGMYAWLSLWIGTPDDTADILRRFTNAERLVARYFLAISSINAGLGAALGGALLLINLPGPFVWAMVAALLNFVLYVGPMTVTAGLLVAGIVAFDDLMVLAPPAIFLALNMLEAQFATPALVGRHISVNPLLIFVSLVFWLWLWGPIGGIIAIPVLVIALALLDIFAVDGEPDKSGP